MLIPFLSAPVPRASGNRGRALTKDGRVTSNGIIIVLGAYAAWIESQEFNIGVLIKRAYLHLSLN